MSATAAIIGAGASLATQGINAATTGSMNKKTRQYNEKMWHMQNEYNSPTNQMQRMREAGVNPFTAFGTGSVSNTASPPPQFNPEVPKFDSSTMLSGYYDTGIKRAQTDNLLQQNTVLANDAALKAANTASTILKTSRDEFELEKAKELRTTSMDFQKEQLRKLQADTQFTLGEEQRRIATTSSNLTEAATRILQMESTMATNEVERARIQALTRNLNTDSKLKELDHTLWKAGISRTDPMWSRVLGQFLLPKLNPSTTKDPRSGAGQIWDAGKNAIKWFTGK